MHRAGVTAAALALVLAAGAAGKVVPNVRGTLARPPATICPTGEPCDPAPLGFYVVFSRSGKVAARVRVRADGSFSTHLRPGRYGISLAPPLSSGTLRPRTVRVPQVGVVRLRLVVRQ